MERPLDGKIGVAIMGGRRTVSRLNHPEAFNIGWRVGDTIVEVGGQPVADNGAVKAAVKEALAQHASEGSPLQFKVRRLVKPPADASRSLLRMTPGTGGELTVSMKDLIQSMVQDFPVVLFLDGTLKVPNNNLSARAIEILDKEGLAFKAIDCTDEKYNPGVRAAVEELAGEHALPQLFAGGRLLGNGYKIQELDESGELISLLRMAGAVKVSS